MRRLVATVATSAVVVLGLAIPGAVSPAAAAVGSESNSAAQFLDLSALGIDTSGIVGIDGATAQYVDGTTAGTSVTDDQPLDVSALSALTLPLPNNVGLTDLLDLGLITQQAEADPDGVSNANTDTASLGLDLDSLLSSVPALSGVINTAGLDLGAVGSTASIDASDPSSLTRTTEIANANLDLHSPTVSTLTSTLTSTISTLNTTLNGAISTLDTALTTALSAVPGATVNVGTLDLNATLASLLDQPITLNGVTVDLSTGTISVNLADLTDSSGNPLLDLNDLPPNSTLLSAAVLQNITDQVNSLLQSLQNQVNSIVNQALDSVSVTISGSVGSALTGGVTTVAYDGSLGDLLTNQPDIASGTGITGAALATTINTAVSTALGVADGTVTTAISTAGTAVDAAVTTATNALDPALQALAGVVAVNLNVQNDGDGITSAADVTAVQVTLLPNGSAVTLNLATSQVGPNTYQATTPTLAASGPVEVGDATTVTGDTWPPNTDVSLQLTDPDGNPVGAPVVVTTDADGAIPANTTITVPNGSPVGDYSIVGTTAGGQTATAPFQVVDTTAPDAPVITGPADGSTIADNTPTITGTGEPGDTVTVTDENGDTIGTATVGDDGTWTLTPTTPLDDGDHTITATQTDPAGNTSPASAPSTFTVDTQAPAAPVITGPADGSTTSDNTPTISGTGEAGDTVTVTDQNGNVLGTAVVGDDGTWSFDSTQLDDGDYTITATQTDPAGNTSPASAPSTFTVDTTAPDAPVITSPADGSSTNDTTPPITGTGEPGDTVTVTDQNGDTIGTTTVGDDGSWTLTPTTPFDEGDHTITATQTDPAGNTSPASDPVTFTVDTTAPDAPVITGPANGSVTTDTTPTITGTGEPGATVTVTDQNGDVLGTATVDGNGDWSFDSTALTDGTYTITATQTDAAGNTSPASAPDSFTVDTTAPDAPVITGPANGSTTSDTTPAISGTGEAGDTVTVTDQNGDVLGTAVVDGNGNWTFDSTQLDDGTYTITATQTDPAGNTSPASDPVTFTVDTTAPDAPVISTPADGSSTNDTTPPITGTGEPGSTVTVTDENGDTVGTAVVDGNGDWTLTPTTPFDEGDHTITATQTDPAGNTSPASDPVTFTVDTTAPDAPVITGPANGSSTNDTTPTISGTGEPGATVTVTDQNGDVLGTATVGNGGNWSFDSTELTDGPYTITATQTDPAGNTSPASDPVTFTVDTTAPDAPVITGPTDGSTVGDSTPTITGTGEVGDTVTVTDENGDTIGTTTVGDDGTWTLTPTTPFDDGDHIITATQTDPAGNTSPASDPVTFTVDTTAPKAPVITGPADGTTTTDSTPEITGTGTPGSTVTVTDQNGDTLGTATVGDDGSWSLTPADPLDDDTYTITATQTDAAGNTSPASNPVIFTVDTTAPDAPVITGPADGSSTNDNTPAISGTGEPGATVTVTDQNGDTLGTATVDGNGNWTFDSTQLDDGTYTITATQTDPAGNTSPASAPSTFTVDTTAPDAPVITGPADGSSTNDTTPPITGTGEPGATVTVTDENGDTVGTATVGDDGTWKVTPSAPFDDGSHTITATQTDPAGNTSDPVTSTFAVDTTAPKAPVITGPADGTLTGDNTPTVTGTGEPGATVTVSDQNGNTVGTTTVNGDGTWTLTPTTPLPDGSTTLTATQTDPDGNTSPASDPVKVTVDTTAKAPVVTSPADGSSTTDHKPTVTGTGEPGATVTVMIDGNLVGTAKVGPGGHWSVPVTTALADGSHTVVATQTDKAGNTSPAATSNFTVVPATPSITSPSNGDTVSSTPTIKGNAPSGTAVDVLVDGKTAGSTHADTSGSWSVTLPQLTCGKHTLTATASTPGRLFDAFAHPAARSTSAASDPVHVKVRCTGNSSADTGSNGSQSSGTGPAADTSGSGTTLPNTGAPANTLPIAALAGLLLLGGFALIGIALGRRHEHE